MATQNVVRAVGLLVDCIDRAWAEEFRAGCRGEARIHRRTDPFPAAQPDIHLEVYLGAASARVVAAAS